MLLLFLAILILSPVVFAKSESLVDEQRNILSTLNSYYLFSSQENIEEYYDVISLVGFSQKDILGRKENTLAIWDEYDTLSYSLQSVIPTVETDLANVYYSLTATIRDSFDEEITVTRDMVAIIFKENGFWKVWATMPRSSYDLRMATYGEELGLQSNQPVEPKSKSGFQNFKEKLFGEKIDLLSQPVAALCGNNLCEDGETTKTCNKDCPKIGICLYDEEIIFDLDGLNFQGSSLSDIPPLARNLIARDGLKVEIKIFDVDKDYNFIINDEILNFENDSTEKPDFIIKMSSCLLKNLFDGTEDILSAYENKEIVIESTGFGNSVKKGLLSAFVNVRSWFNKDNSKQVSHSRFASPIRGPVFMINS